jgi:hypothetical protein
MGSNVTALKTITPHSPAYINEASYQETNFKETFWGPNYALLSGIKLRWDRKHVFYATPGINADHFVADGGRLCRVWPSASAISPNNSVPAGDNQNMALVAPAWATANPWEHPAWPVDQSAADSSAELHSSKMASISEMSLRFKEWQTRRPVGAGAGRMPPSASASASVGPGVGAGFPGVQAMRTSSVPGWAPRVPNWTPVAATARSTAAEANFTPVAAA